MDPKISIIMVDGGFRENFFPLRYWLDQTLPADAYELIWVDYSTAVAPEIASNPRIRSKALGRTDEPQRLGMAYNEAIRMARGEILVIPDADVACERDLLETVLLEMAGDDELVLYVLRLDQMRTDFKRDQSLDHLRATCSVKHTFNFGGCCCVHRSQMVRMNGYEQLPIFAAYHYCGGDNDVRFKNMGLKRKWHPTQRVYHAWHTLPGSSSFDTAKEQDRFIAHRAATWDWLAYDGMDPALNRPFPGDGFGVAEFPSSWPRINTERGVYHSDSEQKGTTASEAPMPLKSKLTQGIAQIRGKIKA